MGREGDFLELKDSSIFEVKGLIHPNDKLISFPRYIPDENGERKKGDKRYSKIYPLKDRFDILKKKYSHLLVKDSFLNMTLPEISNEEILVHYKPEDVMERLRKKKNPDTLEQKVIDFSHMLVDYSKISFSAIGISGSIMIGFHLISSDMDIIIYGRNECKKIRSLLQKMLFENEQVRYLIGKEMENLYRFRGANDLMSLQVFSKHENRKTFQGIFMGQEFFIRYLPDWLEINEEYGSRKYISSGNVKIKAIVNDDSESFFSPCKYLLEQVEIIDGSKDQNIVEAVSFRGRFCEQAKVGEQVIIQGKSEKVLTSEGEYHRVLLGGSPSDYMISLSI